MWWIARLLQLQTRHHISPPRTRRRIKTQTSYRSPLSSLSIFSRPVISDQPVGAGLMDADNADNAMLPGLYKYHEAPSRLSQRHQSCKESELLLETVWTPGSWGHHATTTPPHTGNLTNIWSCCESKVSLIIGNAFFLYKLFPVRWAAGGCLLATGDPSHRPK